MVTNEERGSLVRFLDDVYKLLELVAKVEPNRYIVPELREEMAKAWQEVQGRFSQVRSAILGGSHDQELERVGLTGAQLALKLKGAGSAIRRFFATPTLLGLRLALDWINTLLGSLTEAIGIAEPIKELKEAIHNSLLPEG